MASLRIGIVGSRFAAHLHLLAYVVEKIGTKEGWSHPAADEEWQQGFYAEIQDFAECCASGRRPQSGALVAHDTVAALYAGYVSAERKGQEVPVPIAPIGDVE